MNKLSVNENSYQELAARTINKDLTKDEQKMHALHGMVGEIGEIHSLYQKVYQNHGEIDKDHLIKEVGDLLWFIAEFCTSIDVNLIDVMNTNIEKLRKRYPNGFDSERSIHREQGDI